MEEFSDYLRNINWVIERQLAIVKAIAEERGLPFDPEPEFRQSLTPDGQIFIQIKNRFMILGKPSDPNS